VSPIIRIGDIRTNHVLDIAASSADELKPTLSLDADRLPRHACQIPGFKVAIEPSSVVQTKLKSLGCRNNRLL
jgi:hypothetical protein